MGAVECRSICTQRAPYVSTYTLTGSSARWARVVARGACRACPRHDVTEAWKSRRLVLRPPLLGTTVVRPLLRLWLGSAVQVGNGDSGPATLGLRAARVEYGPVSPGRPSRGTCARLGGDVLRRRQTGLLAMGRGAG